MLCVTFIGNHLIFSCSQAQSIFSCFAPILPVTESSGQSDQGRDFGGNFQTNILGSGADGPNSNSRANLLSRLEQHETRFSVCSVPKRQLNLYKIYTSRTSLCVSAGGSRQPEMLLFLSYKRHKQEFSGPGDKKHRQDSSLR